MRKYNILGVLALTAILQSPVLLIWIYYKLRKSHKSFNQIFDLYNEKDFRNNLFFAIFFILAASFFVAVLLHFGHQTEQTYDKLLGS